VAEDPHQQAEHHRRQEGVQLGLLDGEQEQHGREPYI
jgi:hypothetical protein